jgi:hypothetical protein
MNLEYPSTSVYWNQRDALFIQFIKNYGPLHVELHGVDFHSNPGSSQLT